MIALPELLEMGQHFEAKFRYTVPTNVKNLEERVGRIGLAPRGRPDGTYGNKTSSNAITIIMILYI